jgi:isoaspartyl peptidase/L-asparaginase-like protein (Ntn-hydrolase superfamily)
MQRGSGGGQEQPQQQQQQQSSLHQQSETLDTVGSIAIDSFGRVSAGVSSGDLH